MRNHKAFTLAEVLITLGIIGVVAALTIPTLISGYRKRVIETKLTKFYATMNQAIKRSVVDNESLEGWDLKNDELLMKKYIFPYLNGASYVDDSSDTIKLSNGMILSYGELNNDEGSSSLSESQADLTVYLDPKIYKVCIDEVDAEVNGEPVDYSKCHKHDGVEIFSFIFPKRMSKQILNNKMQYLMDREAMGDDTTSQQDEVMQIFRVLENNEGIVPHPGKCVRGSDYVTLNNHDTRGCANLIKNNNWKIPKDYPIKF